MTTEITISQIYWNKSLLDFFFRSQSQNTFEELCNSAKCLEGLFEEIENLFDNLDDFEEYIYEEDEEEIKYFLGSDLFNE